VGHLGADAGSKLQAESQSRVQENRGRHKNSHYIAFALNSCISILFQKLVPVVPPAKAFKPLRHQVCQYYLKF
jgi:hypothetical protein